MMDEKLRKRLEKLYAMAEDASSEHEAMIAARRLQALLAKHGLSEADLGRAGEAQYGQDHWAVGSKMSGWWAKGIAQYVARVYFCEVYIVPLPGQESRIVVNGSDTYRDAAVLMVRSVVTAVDREARLASKTDRPRGESGRAYITSFRNAAAHRIILRCQEMIAAARRGELKDDETGETLPVLASLYDTELQNADEFMRSQTRLRTQQNRVRSSSAAGRARGEAFGDRVSLGHELKGKAPRALGKL